MAVEDPTHRLFITVDVVAPDGLPGLPMVMDWSAALGLDDPAKLYPHGVRKIEIEVAPVEGE